MANNFKQAKRVVNDKLIQQRLNLLGAEQRYPAPKYTFKARSPPTPQQLAQQHAQLASQKANLAKAAPHTLFTQGGGPPNNAVLNSESDSNSDSDVTEVLNPNELPNHNNEPPVGNNRPVSVPQGGRRRRRRTSRVSGGTHRRGHKGRHSRRRHSRRSRRRHSRR